MSSGAALAEKEDATLVFFLSFFFKKKSKKSGRSVAPNGRAHDITCCLNAGASAFELEYIITVPVN